MAKQRAARFWADKRNISGMKKFLEDVAKRAARIRGRVAVSGDRVGDTLPPVADHTIAINKL